MSKHADRPIKRRCVHAISVGEVFVDSKQWGKISLEEFTKRGGRITFKDEGKEK